MSEGWARAEMQGAALGDHRSRTALGAVCQRLADQPEASWSSACGPAGRQAIARLFRREDSTVPNLLAGHYGETARRCAHHPFVLVVQDTTELNYSHHPATTGLGPLVPPERQGVWSHAALALTPSGEPLGLLHLDLWAREATQAGQAARRRQRAPAEKESRKWAAALAAVAAQLPRGPEVLLIQDREGDVFDFLATPRRPGLHLLVRAAQSRKVTVPGAAAHASERLFTAAAAGPILGTVTVEAPARAATTGRKPQPAREARQVTLTVRVTALTLQPPQHGQAVATWTPQPVWVVSAVEETPPGDLPATEVIQWILISTRAVEDYDAACACVTHYSLRWRIERLHYTLKSGCKVEALQIETAAHLQKAVALYYVIAWRLLWLTYTARTRPEAAAETVCTPAELQVLREALQQPVRTAQEAMRGIAQLAGWRGYRSAPDPGVQVLWRGLRRLTDMTTGWCLAQPRDPIQP